MGAYGQSKLAVALFAEELDRRLRAAGAPVTSVLAHPGLVGDRCVVRPARRSARA